MPTPHGPALVTGASGFIGTHLVRRLAREGYPIVGLDREPPRAEPPPGMRFLRADIRDADALRAAFAEAKPDTVYHLAAQTSVTASMRDPVADIEANVLGTVRVAQAAREVGTRRIVFFSTGGALYGEPDRVPVDEETAPRPTSLYGASKLAAERYLQILSGEDKFELSVLRPGNVYGPGQDSAGEAGVVAIFSTRMLHDEPVTIFGDGSQARDYVYVDDVVEAALRAATGDPATCLIGTGVATGTLDLCERLARLCGYERAPLFADERPGDIQRITLDAARARSAWGWEPGVRLDEGLAATVDWFREATEAD